MLITPRSWVRAPYSIKYYVHFALLSVPHMCHGPHAPPAAPYSIKYYVHFFLSPQFSVKIYFGPRYFPTYVSPVRRITAVRTIYFPEFSKNIFSSAALRAAREGSPPISIYFVTEPHPEHIAPREPLRQQPHGSAPRECRQRQKQGPRDAVPRSNERSTSLSYHP